MRGFIKIMAVLIGASQLAGCIVREEPPPRRVYVYDNPPPPEVDVVSVAPGPDFVWIGGIYVHEGDHWRWHHGYYGHP